MRAVHVTEHGLAPSLAEVPEPEAGDGEVLVGVTAVSITPLDLLCASGTSYFGPPALPYVPGVQGVGVVRQGPDELVGESSPLESLARALGGSGVGRVGA